MSNGKFYGIVAGIIFLTFALDAGLTYWAVSKEEPMPVLTAPQPSLGLNELTPLTPPQVGITVRVVHLDKELVYAAVQKHIELIPLANEILEDGQVTGEELIDLNKAVKYYDSLTEI